MEQPTFKAIIPPPKSDSRDFDDLESALAWLSETGNGYVMERREPYGEHYPICAVKNGEVILVEALAETAVTA